VVEPYAISDTNKKLLYFQECRASNHQLMGLTDSIIARPANNTLKKAEKKTEEKSVYAGGGKPNDKPTNPI
jgi:hypothetical protein